MTKYKKWIKGLFSNIINVKVNKTIISESDLVELGVKTPDYKILSYYDNLEGETRTFWEFKVR
jgi:hypothetical protein